MSLPFYGRISSLAIDPIEKKPLYHFLPGSGVFSAGFVGCDFFCPFCQNWQISQEVPASLEALSPEELIAEARRSGCPSIAYTYSEPTIHFEYLRKAMALARKAGIKNVLVTNGGIVPEAARELLTLTDAANIDLKCWSEEAYKKVLGGERGTVLEFIRSAVRLCHVEVTSLVVPGLCEWERDIASIAEFLAGLSPDIPFHLSAYHPAWKYRQAGTELALLERLTAIAKERLRFVYVGNVLGRGDDTLCPGCGAAVIRRRGYRIDASGLKKAGGRGLCAACREELPIIV
jgi:Pyruvate-formate lyase-activating enzyme